MLFGRLLKALKLLLLSLFFIMGFIIMNNLIKLDTAYAVCFCNANDANQGLSAVKLLSWSILLSVLMHIMSLVFLVMFVGLIIIGVKGGPNLFKTPVNIDAQVVN